MNEKQRQIKEFKEDGYADAWCPMCCYMAREDEYTGKPILSNYCPECGEELIHPAAKKGLEKLLESSIETGNAVLAHYDFVISDISSELSNPVLEARKAPSIEFLKAMRGQWQKFQDDAKSQLEELQKGE